MYKGLAPIAFCFAIARFHCAECRWPVYIFNEQEDGAFGLTCSVGFGMDRTSAWRAHRQSFRAGINSCACALYCALQRFSMGRVLTTINVSILTVIASAIHLSPNVPPGLTARLPGGYDMPIGYTPEQAIGIVEDAVNTLQMATKVRAWAWARFSIPGCFFYSSHQPNSLLFILYWHAVLPTAWPNGHQLRQL